MDQKRSKTQILPKNRFWAIFRRSCAGIWGFCAGICPVVREIVREFAFLCGNFLKNLAMANFLRFWVNFGLFCVFRRFSEFLKEL